MKKAVLPSAALNADLSAYIALFVVLFIVRLPSFFFSVFDWDESTFILVGQSILNGYLPYVDAWDMKPPLLHYVFALFLTLFGKSIASVRLGGLLCIYIASIFLYETAKVIQDKTAGMISALFLAVFVSTGFSGLSTMSEHILLVPISFVLYVLLTREIDKKATLVMGITLGMAILIKTSMVLESFGVCTVLLSGYPNPSVAFSGRLKRCVFLIIGISLPICFVGFYYFANDELGLLLKTNIDTVFAYVGVREVPLLSKMKMFISNITENVKMNPLAWTVFCFGIISLMLPMKEKSKFLPIAMMLFAAQMFSLFIISRPHGYHYLVMTMPIMCLVSGVALSPWLSRNEIGGKIRCLILVTLIVSGCLFSLRGNVVKRYGELFSLLLQKQPLLNDSCYKVAEFLKKNDVKDRYIYMVDSCQIVYWLTESKYPTKYVHPSTIFRYEYMLRIIDGPNATGEKELLNILGKRPEFIVYIPHLRQPSSENLRVILENDLEANYEWMETIDTYFYVYRRKTR